MDLPLKRPANTLLGMTVSDGRAAAVVLIGTRPPLRGTPPMPIRQVTAMTEFSRC
jgi:hypothetical protein